MTLPYEKVHIVINPAAGQNEPILNVLNDVFHPTGVDWEISLTRQSGDATRLAAEAVASGVDLVAAYGGDGTQMGCQRAAWQRHSPSHLTRRHRQRHGS